MSKFFKAFVRDERGVSAMEYAILAGVVAVALTAAAGSFSTNLSGVFTKMWAKVTTAQS